MTEKTLNYRKSADDFAVLEDESTDHFIHVIDEREDEGIFVRAEWCTHVGQRVSKAEFRKFVEHLQKFVQEPTCLPGTVGFNGHSVQYVGVKTDRGNVNMAVCDSTKGAHTKLCFAVKNSPTIGVGHVASADLSEQAARELRDALNRRLGGEPAYADHMNLRNALAKQQEVNVQQGKRIEELLAQLDAQKRDFVQKVVDYDHGCSSGKEEFLEWAGLPIPTADYQLVVNVTVAALNDDDVISELEYNARNGYDLRNGLGDSATVTSTEACLR